MSFFAFSYLIFRAEQDIGFNIFLYGFCFLSIVIFFLVFLIKKFLTPLREIAHNAKEISHGNLNRKIRIKSSEEYAEITEAIEHLASNLNKFINPVVKTDRLANLGRLASGIAHEVRNPLEPIKGSAELLQNLYREDEVIKKYTQIIKDEISVLSSFLDEFLEFARPREPSFQQTDINILVAETLSLMEHYATEHNMRISKNLSGNLPRIYVDPQQIKQVFMNIIINAVQAKKNGEGLLTVKTRAEEFVVIEFFDYGKGIPRDKLGEIFEPFFTTKEKGTGLGLAMCRNIIIKHGGRIEIDSGYGQWTLVRIIFPVRFSGKK